jgi:hypothetical protein
VVVTILERVARAIYTANWRPSAPEWAVASRDVRDWVFRQARAALAETQKDD